MRLFYLCVCLLAACAAFAETLPQRSEDFVPMGVYFAVEDLWSEYGAQRWDKFDAALDDMAAHNINTVWLVNANAAFMAEFARRAALRDIYLVACPGEIGLRSMLELTEEQWRASIEAAKAIWGDAPLPVAWGIYDEPLVTDILKLKRFIEVFHEVWPNEPIATVLFWPDMSPYFANIGLEYLCADHYAFRPHWTADQSFSSWRVSGTHFTQDVEPYPTKPWYMGQQFQELTAGDFTVDSNGLITILPGCGATWYYPSPAQSQWQVWAAIAYGNKGYYQFVYCYPHSRGLTTTNPLYTYTQTVETNAPVGMVTYPDLGSTAQYEATAEAYGKMTQASSIITGTTRIWRYPPATLTSSPGVGGLVTVLQENGGDTRYVVVAAPFNVTEDATMTITVENTFVGLQDVFSNEVYLPQAGTIEVTLAPGSGTILEELGRDDTDGDGLPDWRETMLGTDPAKSDTDGDGVLDGTEVSFGYDPLDPMDIPQTDTVRVPEFAE